MSNPVNPFAEADAAESQRKTFKGIGCAAGALAFPAPFLFGFPGGFAMVPVLVIIGFVFMFLAISAKSRRDRAAVAASGRVQQQNQFTPNASAVTQPYVQPAASVVAPTQHSQPHTADSKLNERLNKAKKAGF